MSTMPSQLMSPRMHVVFSSTDTLLETALATSRSGRPSPFTSAAATETGPVPAAKLVAAAKLGTTAPGAVVFSSTDTLLVLLLATSRSGRPSPFTSAAATEPGALPAAKLVAAAKLGTTAPGAVVFSSTDPFLVSGLATSRSGRPSPFTSAAATEAGTIPAAKLVAAAKLGTAAPGAVVFSSTD